MNKEDLPTRWQEKLYVYFENKRIEKQKKEMERFQKATDLFNWTPEELIIKQAMFRELKCVKNSDGDNLKYEISSYINPKST